MRFSKSDLKWVLLIILVMAMISQINTIEGKETIDRQETTNQEDINEYSYNTDYVTVFPSIEPDGGATTYVGTVILDAINEVCITYFYIGDKIDHERPMTLTWDVFRTDANADTITIKKSGYTAPCDGSTAATPFWDDDADTLLASDQNRWTTKTWVVPKENVIADSHYVFSITMNEAARGVRIYTVAVSYFIRKVLE